MLTLGVDVGGTHIRAGAVDDAGRVRTWRRDTTPANGGPESLVDWVARAGAGARELTGGHPDAFPTIGLALPGIVDDLQGRLVRSLNLSDLEGYPLAESIAVRTGTHVHLVTDMQAATWAEFHTHRPAVDRFVHLRIGTGVGCCAVLSGELESPDPGRMTHHPVLVVETGKTARQCRCGLSGCLETIVGAPALMNAMVPNAPDARLEELRNALHAGDARARELVDRTAVALAEALRNITRTYRPDVISLGGGVIEALPDLALCAIDRCHRRRHMVERATGPLIVKAGLGNHAGVIGAALLAKDAAGLTAL